MTQVSSRAEVAQDAADAVGAKATIRPAEADAIKTLRKFAKTKGTARACAVVIRHSLPTYLGGFLVSSNSWADLTESGHWAQRKGERMANATLESGLLSPEGFTPRGCETLPR